MLYRSLVDISLPLIFLMGEEKLFLCCPWNIKKTRSPPPPLFWNQIHYDPPHFWRSKSFRHIYIFLQRWSEQNQGPFHPPYLDQIRTTARDVLYFFGIGKFLSFFFPSRETYVCRIRKIYFSGESRLTIDWRDMRNDIFFLFFFFALLLPLTLSHSWAYYGVNELRNKFTSTNSHT